MGYYGRSGLSIAHDDMGRESQNQRKAAQVTEATALFAVCQMEAVTDHHRE